MLYVLTNFAVTTYSIYGFLRLYGIYHHREYILLFFTSYL